ncbi:MAG: LysR family transcriptional regulator [Acholeplasmatales bacterium]|nr:LysR family transcriptional regulator [Acholeplasmatales bacterium]
MTLKQLEYVIKVAETKNITSASNELFIAQPSLTHSINELEKEMGITIFRRTNKGVIITNEGEEFLSYARQVLEQANLLNDRFINKENRKPKFSVSCQHYSFCISAFSDTVKEFDSNQYDFTIRETQTHELIEDVTNLKSEIGVLFLSNFNREVLKKLLNKNELEFVTITKAYPHVFISKDHPLAQKDIITLNDLKPYPYLTYEQGNYNSFYFSEEFLSTMDIKKNIMVRDRATLFNLCVSLNGYTVSSGIILKDVNAQSIIAKPLKYNEIMEIGYIKRKNMPISEYGKAYIKYLIKYTTQ